MSKTESRNDGDEETTTEDIPLSFVEPPTDTLDDVVGADRLVETVRLAVIDPLVSVGRAARTHGVLVHGPSGVGKTHVAEAIAGELAGSEFDVARLGDLLGLDVRETASRVCDRLVQAEPCVVLADPLSNPTHDGVATAVKSLLTALNERGARVLVVATHSHDRFMPGTTDAFQGFEVKVEVETPGTDRRERLLEAFLSDLTDGAPVTCESIRDVSAAVGEDAEGLTAVQLRTAGERAVHLAQGTRDDAEITETELRRAVEAVREESDFGERNGPGRGFAVAEAESPGVSFSDIGGLGAQKRLLREYLSFSTSYGDLFDSLGIDRSRGVLLYGPPGNGKTMLAEAVATEGDRAFFAVSGPELKAPYVGQTERRIRQVFEAARDAAPSVVFFDEFDALAPNRDTVGTATYKVDHVNTLLSELDGFDSDADVLVVAATNRRDAIDPAVLRPGRIGDHLEVTAPDAAGRRAVLETTTADYPLADDVTVEWLADAVPAACSAATVVGCCEKALHVAVRSVHERGGDSSDVVVEREHVRTAVAALDTERSTGAEDVAGYR